MKKKEFFLIFFRNLLDIFLFNIYISPHRRNTKLQGNKSFLT
jgi:hypothetical protein